MKKIKKKRIKRTPMIKGSNRHYWNIQIYEHYGKEYVLSNTFDTKKEAEQLQRDIEKYPENKAVIRKEDKYYRVYSLY